MSINEHTMSYTGPFMNKTTDPSSDKVVLEIIEALGGTTDIKAIIKTYIDRSRGDPELADHNAHAQCLYAFNRVTNKTRFTPQARAARKKLIREMAEKMARTIRDICIMDLILPNGKAVRDSTFADCARAGGLFVRLAAKAPKGKPNAIVGKVLTDKQAQALWRG